MFGVAGVISGAAVVFFAFIGFDIVATTAEEAKNPQRDVPIGILGSLAIVTVLYAAVSLVVTGVQNYTDIDPEDQAPLATAFDAAGVSWMGDLISVGACIGLVVVAMILMLGQMPRRRSRWPATVCCRGHWRGCTRRTARRTGSP